MLVEIDRTTLLLDEEVYGGDVPPVIVLLVLRLPTAGSRGQESNRRL